MQKLAKSNSKPASTKRRNPGKAPMSELANYNTKTLIFDDNVPERHYIEAFTLRNRYTDPAPGAKYNLGHSLRYGKVGDVEFF